MRKKKVIVVTLIIMLMCTFSFSLAQSENGDHDVLEETGRWAYGPVRALTGDVTNIYCGNGGYFQIIAIATQNEVGKVALPEPMQGIAVDGDGMSMSNYAYIADGESGLRIINISTPAEVGYCSLPGEAKDVAVDGNYAYVACGSSGLRIINIADKTAPVEVSYHKVNTDAQGVCFSNDTVFVAYGDKIRAYDVSTPEVINVVGSKNTSGTSYDVFVSGDSAYVADGENGLVILDISDLINGNITETGSFDTDGTAFDVFVVGDSAYVADDDCGMRIIDVSGPNETRFFDNISDEVKGVYVSGTDAFLAYNYAGLQVLDLSAPLAVSWEYNFGGYDRDVDVSGDYAYIADSKKGLRIIDISDPTSPAFEDTLNLDGLEQGVDVLGDYAYVACGIFGLCIVDVSNPSAPVEVGNYDTYKAHSVVVSDTIAVVADGDRGVVIVNVSDPTSPTELSHIEQTDAGDAKDVDISGDYLYVAAFDEGLKIFDISDPSSPQYIDGFDTQGHAYGITVFGNYAYLADDEMGLRIISIQNPETPSEIGYYDTPSPGRSRDVSVFGNYAYVADYANGVQLIEVSDPTSPSLVGYYNTGDMANGVYGANEYVYVADGDDGFYILDNRLLYLYEFTPVGPTGDSHPVIIDNAVINNEQIDPGDEIAIFDGETKCVGAATYTGTFPFHITVWMQYITFNGDTLPGAVSGNNMIFKVYDSSEDTTLGGYPDYASGSNGTFGEIITEVDELQAYLLDGFQQVDPTGEVQIVTVNSAEINEDNLSTGDEIAVYDGTLCVGAVSYQGSYPVEIPVWLEEVLPDNSVLPGAEIGNSMSFEIYSTVEDDTYPAQATYEAGSSGVFSTEPVTVLKLTAVNTANDTITINPDKLNWISFNIQPPDANSREINVMLDDVDDLVIAQDDEGNMYIQSTSYNTIGMTDFSNGYEVYYSAGSDDEIINDGFVLKPDTITQYLNPNKIFNIAYPYRDQYAVTDVFSSISSAVVIVKDDEGNFWLPDYGINSINDMQPGEGYKIYVDEYINFTYPDLASLSKPTARQSSTADNVKVAKSPEYFDYKKTGLSHCILIKDSQKELSEGDEIGIFAGDFCVGAAVYHGTSPLAVAAWEKFELDNILLKGFEVNQPISVRVWKSNEQVEYNVAVKNKKTFSKEPVSILTLGNFEQRNVIPDSYSLNQNYPNPFNPETTIQYDIPEPVHVNIVIYNTLGEKIKTLVDEEKKAGVYTVLWNGTNDNGVKVGSGVYIIKMFTNQKVKMRKMLLVK